jgi:hypothetical protein
LNDRRTTSRHDSTPTTKSPWFDDHDTLEDDHNDMKPQKAARLPDVSLSVQGFFERLSGDEPPTS